jgi:phosphatidylglycerophosphate synthase
LQAYREHARVETVLRQATETRWQSGADILLSALALAGFILVIGSVASTRLELGPDFLLRETAAFCAAVVIIFLAFFRRGPGRFGAANRITLLRVALLALVAGSYGEVPGAALCWAIIGVTTTALILDGFDGFVARKSQTHSAFGARFDMETDAATILVLAVLCWQFGKAGSWIIAAGAMRYVFVGAARLLPWMRRTLPPSRRRQTICILQSAGLLAVISPLFIPPVSSWLALATLIMLGSSFAVDVRWLWRERVSAAGQIH